jgi:hypothetical protein
MDEAPTMREFPMRSQDGSIAGFATGCRFVVEKASRLVDRAWGPTFDNKAGRRDPPDLLPPSIDAGGTFKGSAMTITS